jgi:hypothetical protein
MVRLLSMSWHIETLILDNICSGPQAMFLTSLLDMLSVNSTGIIGHRRARQPLESLGQPSPPYRTVQPTYHQRRAFQVTRVHDTYRRIITYHEAPSLFYWYQG